MFRNAGAKIQVLAWILFFLIIFGGSAAAILITVQTSLLIYLLYIPASVLSGWLSTIALYAFGELCENVSIISRHYEKPEEPQEALKEEPSAPWQDAPDM